ncbi:hypothetical protein HOP62_09315 [Halomonas sp. MCCC 1A17488]|uniref:Uncharacterized protein n=1 Tax=Billgrantia sulfidoxydans TaxID=2733484 RepID=A0ABX7W390_9GAMM|nr:MULTISPECIES: hypothetical protein [Halomonas]MCE8016272.1 hypothetical protein [Halomonas sp. MCCC 1A17488]MCG3239605.1 hypothetical protein [Halomonas sp. MCCC 1A17488]QPP50480.1 hypothetical protein I4484_05060 [Halomonas sp. SS10-MC5]QTP54097.1 hypothetical protein HNO51_05020 [Halomonas sulfidoxydans]
MSHDKRASRSARRMTALASAVAVALGTLSLAGCGNDEDELPPVEEERPAMEEQGSPMEDATSDPGIDQTGTASGDGAAEPVTGVEESPEGSNPGASDDVAPEQDPLPEAEQETAPDEQPEGQQATMDEGQEEEPEEEQGGSN